MKKERNFQSLWDKYEAARNSTMPLQLVSFSAQYLAVVAHHVLSKDKSVREELAQLWIHHVELQRMRGVIADAPISSISTLFSFLYDADIAQNILAINNNHKALAAAILQAVVMTREDPVEVIFEEATFVLNVWSGNTLNTAIMRSPAETADYLYGKGVWDLYRPDVNHDIELPARLFTDNVDVNGAVNTMGKQQLLHVELPPGISG